MPSKDRSAFGSAVAGRECRDGCIGCCQVLGLKLGICEDLDVSACIQRMSEASSWYMYTCPLQGTVMLAGRSHNGADVCSCTSLNLRACLDSSWYMYTFVRCWV
ncbi:hypothetical protein KP509_31G018300 [Ceratopteris richardii]|uniref:Uncharacterized protein n=1 Tax=Ceratopteris richardii TaxID=49495 RepID=A0A8T2QXP6_CERRI|nr:hypothetical protein KP509_31G018300 [Ceratopteris richardii]